MQVPTTWSCASCCSSPRISACTNFCWPPFYNNSRDKPPDTISSAQRRAQTRSGCQAPQRRIRPLSFVFPPKTTVAKPNALPQCGPRPNRDRRRFLCRRNTDTDRKFEFTGVGIVFIRNFTHRDPRKALTSFRESETPASASVSFSRLCPRLRKRPVLPAARTEVPFSRHFSVMTGGIKTYIFLPRKKLSGRPGWPNTGCVLAVRCPRSSPGGHKI
jgi:hypothetical protein